MREGPTLTVFCCCFFVVSFGFFMVDDGIKDPNTIINGPS